MLTPLAMVILAKYPTPGRVKTRLQPHLTPDESAEVQRIFLLHVVERLTCLGVADVFVCFDPSDHAQAFAELIGDQALLVAQSDGDLGDRLVNAIASLRDEYAHIVFMGVDSPDVPESHLLDMIDLTRSHDAAIAPTHDGGYWALGVRTEIDFSSVLMGIDWSSGREYQQTMDRLGAKMGKIGIGKLWSDVDHVQDLIALNERLIGSHATDDRLLFAQLKDLCPVLARDGTNP